MESKPLPVGTHLKGRYTITRLIAGGGMAWVYEVQETRSDGSTHTWAMKELRANSNDTEALREGRQMFEQEANLLVDLRHPNLPRVSAFFEQDGRSYLVMDFVRGESLERRLEQANAPMLESQVVEWSAEILEVLHYLHHQPQPIIFRDMKPSNVMITLEGRVKLIDFGIARTYKAGQRKDTISMGSENYAAPEQYTAQSDPRTDIYGLGATMYHLLTNVPPLPHFVPTPRVPIQQYNPAVSEQMAAIVDKAMQHDREQRFQSAREMQEALLAIVSRNERRRIEAILRGANPAAAAPPAPRTAERAPAPAPVVATAQPQPVAAPTPTPPRPAGPEGYSKPCPRCGAWNRASSRFCRQCAFAFVPPLPATLSVVRPEGARWQFPLRERSVLIGRRGGKEPVDLDIEFYDPEGFVSRNHCRITVDQRRYSLIDLDSANGTFVNGERLTPHAPRLLRDGDRIRMGRVVLRFTIH